MIYYDISAYVTQFAKYALPQINSQKISDILNLIFFAEIKIYAISLYMPNA